MVNRVLLDVTGLDVSKAGVDVTTAGAKDLLFSSAWAHVREQVTGITRVTYGAAKITVPFGLTFPRVPYVDLWYKSSSQSTYSRYWVTTTLAEHGSNFYMAYLTTSNIQFLWNSSPQSGVSYFDIAYRVWGYPTP